MAKKSSLQTKVNRRSAKSSAAKKATSAYSKRQPGKFNKMSKSTRSR